jgi:amino-acid N-acetyltransferase
MIGTTITRATPADADAILELLAARDLPTDGLRQHLTNAVVARRDHRVVGSAALEVYADGALLRSVAVASDQAGHGLGADLTNAALDLADELGITTVYLLTTTAERYFPRFGFERISRSDVPASVQTSVEFTSACPSTAIVMRKRRREATSPS